MVKIMIYANKSIIKTSPKAVQKNYFRALLIYAYSSYEFALISYFACFQINTYRRQALQELQEHPP